MAGITVLAPDTLPAPGNCLPVPANPSARGEIPAATDGAAATLGAIPVATGGAFPARGGVGSASSGVLAASPGILAALGGVLAASGETTCTPDGAFAARPGPRRCPLDRCLRFLGIIAPQKRRAAP